MQSRIHIKHTGPTKCAILFRCETKYPPSKVEFVFGNVDLIFRDGNSCGAVGSDALLNVEISVTVNIHRRASGDVDLIDAPQNGEINVTVKYPLSGDIDMIEAPLTSNQRDRYYGSHLSKLRSNDGV
ncbi:unnamed protein product [Linum trigynum]|uniref:Uncharacterized protein n=1 Tax=Linum trigynum TaxID=586398 RepID=A0AAV2DCG3_9ROSI